MAELNDKIKKNLLDLQYNKHLQYYNTSIIVFFTYIIGVAIAFITKQINLKSTGQIVLVTSISIIVLFLLVIFMLKTQEHLRNIPNEIRKLELL